MLHRNQGGETGKTEKEKGQLMQYLHKTKKEAVQS